jgi:hypothetical protein
VIGGLADARNVATGLCLARPRRDVPDRLLAASGAELTEEPKGG